MIKPKFLLLLPFCCFMTKRFNLSRDILQVWYRKSCNEDDTVSGLLDSRFFIKSMISHYEGQKHSGNRRNYSLAI